MCATTVPACQHLFPGPHLIHRPTATAFPDCYSNMQVPRRTLINVIGPSHSRTMSTSHTEATHAAQPKPGWQVCLPACMYGYPRKSQVNAPTGKKKILSAPSRCTVQKSGKVKPGNETALAFNTCQHAILPSAAQGDEPCPAHRVTHICCPDGTSTASTCGQMLLNITLVNRVHHGTSHAPQPHAGC
jgi:hypothetical protein